MPVTEPSAYCEYCGHAHRPNSRCKIRDSWGDRCDCAGPARDDTSDEGEA